MRRRFKIAIDVGQAGPGEAPRVGPPQRRDAFSQRVRRSAGSSITSTIRYRRHTALSAPVAGGGRSEFSSNLRWALADLGVVVLEVERRMAFSSAETKMAGGSNGRLVARN